MRQQFWPLLPTIRDQSPFLLETIDMKTIELFLFAVILLGFISCEKSEEIVTESECQSTFIFQSTAVCTMHPEGSVGMRSLDNELYVAANFKDFADPADFVLGDTIRINFGSPDSTVYKVEGLLCGPLIIGVEVTIEDFCN